MRSAGALVLLLICLSPRWASAEPADPWWGKDKALHFGVSAGLAAGGYGVASLVLQERWQRATAGASFALTLGVGKELYDLAGYGSPSFKDLAWDVAGTLVGTGVALVVDVLIAGEHRSRNSSALLRF